MSKEKATWASVIKSLSRYPFMLVCFVLLAWLVFYALKNQMLPFEMKLFFVVLLAVVVVSLSYMVQILADLDEKLWRRNLESH
jgi:hypothetical protein